MSLFSVDSKEEDDLVMKAPDKSRTWRHWPVGTHTNNTKPSSTHLTHPLPDGPKPRAAHWVFPPTPSSLTSHPTCYQLQDCNEQRRAETEEWSNENKKFSKDSISEGMKLWRGPTRLYKPAAFCFPPSIFTGISFLAQFFFFKTAQQDKR